MIYLQFSAQPTIGSRLICWWTWSKYSHVDFILPDGRLLGARGDGVKIREPYATRRKHIVAVDAPDCVLDIAMSQIGKPYDYTALLGFVVNRDWQRGESWFCSELVAWAFEQCRKPLLNTANVWRITPRDLLLSPYL